MISCQVSENLNIGPVAAQIMMIRMAAAKAQALPKVVDVFRAKTRNASLTTHQISRSFSCFFNSSVWVRFITLTLCSLWKAQLSAIDFPADLRKIEPRHGHAARHRILASGNCALSSERSSKTQPLDSRQLAGSDSLRRDTAPDRSPVHGSPGPMERSGNLSVRRRIRRDGTPLAGNDSRLRRSVTVRTFPVALYSRADFFAGRLYRFLFLGHQEIGRA